MDNREGQSSGNSCPTRRDFLEAGLAGGGSLLAAGLGGLASFPTAVSATVSNDFWVEKSIPELQGYMASGRLTSRELTQGYLSRIRDLNPTLSAVIEVNPEALAIAAERDRERRDGKVRGPLHGVPILVKDNIATADRMSTSAGCAALEGVIAPEDAPLVARLREAGAVLLGKTNCRSGPTSVGLDPGGLNGWSSRGGQTLDPYDTRLRSLRLQLRFGGRGDRQPLCGLGRHRD